MKPIRLAIPLLTVVIGASPLDAQRLLLRSYAVADGLPGDHDRFLWVCTNNGLARFDGSRFVTYGTEDGLPDPVVNDFLRTRSGTRLAATNGGGIAWLEAGAPGPEGRAFTGFPVGSSGASMRVNVVFETRDGTLFAGSLNA